uniref:Uncharacterized protein n=1 Tax=Anguilla anguilla TaxID=7936 RepID=A0A0E9RUB1_ANGAN
MYFLIITCLEKACHFNQLPLLHNQIRHA